MSDVTHNKEKPFSFMSMLLVVLLVVAGVGNLSDGLLDRSSGCRPTRAERGITGLGPISGPCDAPDRTPDGDGNGVRSRRNPEPRS